MPRVNMPWPRHCGRRGTESPAAHVPRRAWDRKGGEIHSCKRRLHEWASRGMVLSGVFVMLQQAVAQFRWRMQASVTITAVPTPAWVA